MVCLVVLWPCLFGLAGICRVFQSALNVVKGNGGINPPRKLIKGAGNPTKLLGTQQNRWDKTNNLR